MNLATMLTLAGIVLAIVILTVVIGWKFLFGLIAFALVLYWIGKLCFTDGRHPDEVHHLKAADGWDLAMWRVRPKTPTTRPVPVLLCHGLGFNQRNFDLTEAHSVAHYLARLGYDCYLPALRGCGPSAYSKWFHPGKWDITFDKFIEFDLPAFFDKIRDLTGAPKVHFIGHSMGGMIGYAIAEGALGARMQSFTSVCGPCFFEHMSQFKSLLFLDPILKVFAAFRHVTITRLMAPIYRFFPKAAGNQEVNAENVDGYVLASAAFNGLENMPSKLLLQFAQWVRDGDFGSHLGAESWQKNLHKITVPIYCLAAPVDQFCYPAAIEDVVNRVSSAKKRYRLFSRAGGGLADYGHGDIVVGRTAPDEVFPTFRDWLAENE